MTFEELADFIDRRMRMSHVYQPVMLETLLSHEGQCSEEQIARALLSYDISQVQYYENITRNMVGRVLRDHGIVTRDRESKTWQLEDFDEWSHDERERLLQKCQDRLSGFLEARGSQPWQHRTKSTGYISGTLRYEILKSAKFRCELCGVSADERALEIDHIVPKNHGGTDDVSNLQALCYSCNAMKQDRDNADLRGIRDTYSARDSDCVFCSIAPDRILVESELAFAIADAFPVLPGHTLVIPKRHTASYFDLGRPEINAVNRLLAERRSHILTSDPQVQGFNIGINDSPTAGQTILHCHVHLIPRRQGDVKTPAGGVRAIIPGMADYTKHQ